MNQKLKLIFMIVIILTANTAAQDTWTWTQRYTNNTKHLNDVAAGANGLFVAVGNAGTILTSPDGIDWTERDSKTNLGLHSVIWGDGMFVAGGDSGVIVTSGDGVDWVVRKSGESESIHSIVLGDEGYVAIADRLSNLGFPFFTSDDGIEWIGQQGTNYGGIFFKNFVYGNGLFMVGNLECYLSISTDGIDWGRLERDNFFGGLCCRPGSDCMPGCDPIYSIAYGNGVFLLLGSYYNGVLARFEEGKNWEILHHECDWLGTTGIDGHSMIYDGTRFIVAGGKGIYFTKNGDEFEQVSAKSWGRWDIHSDPKVSMAYNDSVYVTVYKTEIGTLSKGISSIVNSKQNTKSVSNFKMYQHDKTLKLIIPNQNTRPQIKLFSIVGKRQKIKPTFDADGMILFSVSHLAPGLYVLRVKGKNGNWQKQIVVK